MLQKKTLFDDCFYGSKSSCQTRVDRKIKYKTRFITLTVYNYFIRDVKFICVYTAIVLLINVIRAIFVKYLIFKPIVFNPHRIKPEYCIT